MHGLFDMLLDTQYSHRAGNITLLLMGITVVVLALCPPFWRIIWAPTDPNPVSDANEETVVPIPRYRLFAAYFVIATIFVGSLADLLRDAEHWPWSNFPMYSDLETISDHFDDYRIYGVLASDPTKEIALFNDGRYLQPFDPSRLAECLLKFHATPKIEPALMDCLKRYETLRVEGKHSGPQILGIRFYHETRHIDPMGGNLDDIPPAQDRELLKQVWLPTAEKKS